MKNRTVFFIDGQNLYHSLRNVRLKEIHINWSAFFSYFLSQDDELKQAFWFRPERIQELHLHKENVVWHSLRKSTPFDALSPEEQQLVNNYYQEMSEWLANEKQRFSEVDYKYSIIESEYDKLTIYRSGIYKVDPYTQTRLGEKGVDVALATQMVNYALTGQADKIILISGDMDYAEAMRIVKAHGVPLSLARFNVGYPPKNYSMSKNLTALADEVLEITENDLNHRFKKK